MQIVVSFHLVFNSKNEQQEMFNKKLKRSSEMTTTSTKRQVSTKSYTNYAYFLHTHICENTKK